MKILDFGSGYNPPNGNWLISDPFRYIVDYRINPETYGVDCPDNEFSVVRLRNVVHHVQDLDQLFKELSRITKFVIVIDCAKSFFRRNVFLDKLWYRFVNPRKEIWIAPNYRSIVEAMGSKFYITYHGFAAEKEIIVGLKK